MCFVSLLQPAKKKQRAQVIEFFIDVARECFNIGNFNSLMAIICELFILQSLSIDSHLVVIVKNIYIYTFSFSAGMNMSPVSRLKKTWSKAKTAKFFILEVNTAIHCLRSKRQ